MNLTSSLARVDRQSQPHRATLSDQLLATGSASCSRTSARQLFRHWREAKRLGIRVGTGAGGIVRWQVAGMQ